jgi:hypothetical protein
MQALRQHSCVVKDEAPAPLTRGYCSYSTLHMAATTLELPLDPGSGAIPLLPVVFFMPKQQRHPPPIYPIYACFYGTSIGHYT